MKKLTTTIKGIMVSALTMTMLTGAGSELSAQVRVPDLKAEHFAKSNVLFLWSGEGELNAVASYEYVVTVDKAERLFVIYPIANEVLDMLNGYNLKAGERISFDPSNGIATRQPIAGAGAGAQVTIKANGTISYDPNEAFASTAQIYEWMIWDERTAQEDAYPVVKIGKQLWTRENLRVKHFIDGSPITTGLNKEDWEATKSPAYTIYDANADNLATLGGLYNWYAVTSPLGLALADTRIPSKEDWMVLGAYLDRSGFMPDPDSEAVVSFSAGKLVKATTGWTVPPTGNASSLLQGTDEAMLGLQPAGSTSTSKYFNGYSARGLQAYFWSTTESDYEATKGIFTRFYWDSNVFNSWFEDKFMGYSVRCLLDHELRIPLSSALLPSEKPELKIAISGAQVEVQVPQLLIGQRAALYTIDGRSLWVQAQATEALSLPALEHGVYILRVGSTAVKFVL